MALTAQKLALRLLRYVGISKFAAQAAGSDLDSYTASDGDDAAATINAGLQELWALGPKFLSHIPFSIALPAPVAVTFTATAGSKTISAASPSGSFAQGATIRVTGDPVDNEVVSATALLHPHGGLTGASTGTIYGDAIPLDASLLAVNSPVWLDNIRQLVPAASYDELRRFDVAVSRFEPGINAALSSAVPRTIGIPYGYMVDTFFATSAADGLSATVTTDGGVFTSSNAGSFHGAPLFYFGGQDFWLFKSADGSKWLFVHADEFPAETPSEYWSLSTASNNPGGAYAKHGAGFGFVTLSAALPVSSTISAAAKVVRIVPMPDRAYTLRFEAKAGPRLITVADFANDTDPGVTFGLPNGWDESVLLPICLQRWTANPLFKNAGVKEEIARQYKIALSTLNAQEPHAGRQLRIQSGY